MKCSHCGKELKRMTEMEDGMCWECDEKIANDIFDRNMGFSPNMAFKTPPEKPQNRR